MPDIEKSTCKLIGMKILLSQKDYPDSQANIYPMTNEKNYIIGTQIFLQERNQKIELPNMTISDY